MSAITSLPGSPLAPAPLEQGASRQPAARAASQPKTTPPASAPILDLAAVRQAADQLQRTIDEYAREPRDVATRYDDAHQVYVIEIRERDSGELIVEYPPEKILNVRDRLAEFMGAMFDRKI